MGRWNEAELAEMAAADAEIERTFCLCREDMARSVELDREAVRDSKDYDAEKRRAHYLAHKEQSSRQKKEWYARNKGHAAASSRKWYRENKEKVAAYQKSYREANREKLRAYQREWYRRNRDKSIAKARKWQEENHERYRAYQREYQRESYKKRKEMEGNGKGRNLAQVQPDERGELRPYPYHTGGGEGAAAAAGGNRPAQATDRLGADRTGGSACADRR